MAAPSDALEHLVLESAVGYSGNVPRGLHIHPDGRHLIYSLGSCVVIREVGNPRATTFLSNHSGRVSCLAISRSGRYIASGQATHMGFQADIYVYEFSTRKLVHRMMLHKVRVQDLHFSADEQYLASVGGRDDNTLVVWEVASGRPVCGGHCHSEPTTCVAFFNTSNTHLITGGVSSLRVWEVDYQQRKINAEDTHMGSMRRSITAVAVEGTDRYAYCGTATGDVLCIQLNGPKHFKMGGPLKKLTNGILSIALTDTGDVLVGSGSGEVMLLSKINLKVMKGVSVLGGVTALTTLGEHFFLGTNKSNVYYLNAVTFKEELRQTCHFESVNDVAFPYNYSELFATCGSNDIRLWNARTSAELLRIQVGALECNCIVFSKDGRTIVSGWSDGKIRAFGPQTGRLVYAVNDAHKLTGMKRVSGVHVGVTAVCVDNANRRIVSGGADSQVRVWRIVDQTYQLEASMKEHKATINAIAVNARDTECVSASDDGSCIVWDLRRFMRRNIMYAQTYFKALSFFVDESQLLTAGSDKKLTYWDAVDCTAIREVEGSKTGEINSVDISPDGRFFASGGADKLVKVWGYDEGTCAQIGVGHSCVITKVRIAPDGNHVVSVSDEGAIMIWRVENLKVTQLA